MRLNMLAKKFRLTKRGSFAYVYKKGEAIRGRYITLIYVPGKDLPRIGLSVSNKVGHAVVRNKLKRRMRAVIGANIKDIKPCQAVFAVKSDAGELGFDAVEREITVLLRKSGLVLTDAKEE